jgi:hypothetical protein
MSFNREVQEAQCWCVVRDLARSLNDKDGRMSDEDILQMVCAAVRRAAEQTPGDGECSTGSSDVRIEVSPKKEDKRTRK